MSLLFILISLPVIVLGGPCCTGTSYSGPSISSYNFSLSSLSDESSLKYGPVWFIEDWFTKSISVSTNFLNLTKPLSHVRSMWNVNGQDGGYCFTFNGGTDSLWLFGDTVTGGGCGWLHNTALRVSKASPNAEVVSAQYMSSTDHHTACIVPDDGKTAFWPLGGFEANNALYVFYESTGDNPTVGVARAVIGDNLVFETIVEPSTDGVPPVYSAVSNMKDPTDPYLYVYYMGPPQGTDKERRVKLAKVLPSDIHIASGYTYWNGKNFVVDKTAAADISVYFLMNQQISVVYNDFIKSYVLLTTVFGDQAKLQIADNPWGPFTEAKVIFNQPTEFKPHSMYAGYWLPILAQNGGKTMPFLFSNGVGGFDASPWLVEVEFEWNWK